jgi:hypothetical protein
MIKPHFKNELDKLDTCKMQVFKIKLSQLQLKYNHDCAELYGAGSGGSWFGAQGPGIRNQIKQRGQIFILDIFLFFLE